MDYMSKFFAGLPRALSLLPAVGSIGVVPRKHDRIRQCFDTFNLSFILEGEGDYHYAGRKYPVIAPMVLTQWPGVMMDYGPDDYWVEIYAIFPSSEFDAWRRAGIDPETRCCWPAGNPARLMDAVQRLLGLLERDPPDPLRVDCCICEMAAASLEPAPGSAPASEAAVRLARARRNLREELDRPPDYAGIARRLGMSASTLRRHWRAEHNLPPGRDRASRQREEACRLLVESDLTIKDIAGACGFADALYFSRRFRSWTGDSPSAYRRRYRPW